MSVDLLCLSLLSGLCPKLFEDERSGGSNPQVELELMPLCSVSVACSAVFLAAN